MIPDPLYNIWEHSQNVRELYARRAQGSGEMDAAAQCAEILKPFIVGSPSPPRLLDAGCGSGYLWHSFKKRGLAVEYYGLDYSPSLVEIGRGILPGLGLAAERLICGTIEDLHGQSYDLAALLNTLTFCPDFRRPLDRIIESGPRAIALRDNFGDETIIRWEIDGYLDDGFNHLKAYWNQWSRAEVIDFFNAAGYEVTVIKDKRTGGRMEPVVGKPYYWGWLLAVK